MKNNLKQWKEAQKFEKDWWGDCTNTYGEEEKQLTYARRMGLEFFHNGKSPYNIDLNGKSVLDIGGGAASLLLKCVNGAALVVCDPLPMPFWVEKRYESAGIIFGNYPAERLSTSGEIFDEVWIYNCLQHTIDPKKIIENAKKVSKIIRIFEWVETGTNHGHPHELSEENLNLWLGGEGKVEMFNAYTLYGKAYYGVFKGDHYEKV